MSIPVVADADTLFPATTRGLLIYLDYRGLIKLHWSPLILDEVSRALVDTARKKSLAEAKAHEERMCDALPNALIQVAEVQAQFEVIEAAVNSAKDAHVAACSSLATLGIALRKPDVFLNGMFEMQPRDFAFAFHQFRTDLASRPAPEALLEKLRKDGQMHTARALPASHQTGAVRL